MIKLQNVSKIYQISEQVQLNALTNINLIIKDGEMASLIGPSGCGKSTLMHIIGLLDKPTTGSLFIDNQNTANLNDNDLSRLRNEAVGFVFQQFNLINKLTILENVLLPTMYTKKTKNINFEDKAMSLLDRFGIANKASVYPNKISGGQQQRAAIARALINNPRLILADEPTGNLDSKSGKEILDLLTELNRKENITIIIVTHDPVIAARAKKTIKLSDGKLL